MEAVSAETSKIQKIVDKMSECVATADLASLRKLFKPDAAIWHAVDNKSKTLDEAMEFLGGFMSVSKQRASTHGRILPTPQGFVSQNVLHVVFNNDHEVFVPTCTVITLDGDLIARFEEYFHQPAMPVEE